jgi:transposase
MFVMAFEWKYTETFWEGHVRAFEFFGGVLRKITYDNTRVAVGAVVPAASAARWWNVKCQDVTPLPLLCRLALSAFDRYQKETHCPKSAYPPCPKPPRK